MSNRTWESGLQQRIQAKGGVDISTRNGTRARIPHQRLSWRYLRISGISGAIREAAGALWAASKLNSVTNPAHHPSGRAVGADRVYEAKSEQQQSVIASVQARRRRGQIASERKFRLGPCADHRHLAEPGKTEISI